MKISSVKNEFGDPIGLPVGEVTRPGLPDESVMLTGNYCYLEVLDADKHAAELWSVYSLDTDGRLWTYMPQGPFSSESEYRTWVEGVAHKADPFFYAIIDSETNKAVGVASYLRVDPNNYSIEVGWITYSPVIQQKPIATEAMYLMMKNAFDLGYRRYEWKCNSLNLPSINAAMRLGMSFEGLFRQMSIVKGQNRDTAWFSILDRDWPVAQDAYVAWLDPENFDADGNQILRLSDLTAPIVESRWPNLRLDVQR
jgi:RimJ/RimL family protein N-acetyltransferase